MFLVIKHYNKTCNKKSVESKGVKFSKRPGYPMQIRVELLLLKELFLEVLIPAALMFSLSSVYANIQLVLVIHNLVFHNMQLFDPFSSPSISSQHKRMFMSVAMLLLLEQYYWGSPEQAVLLVSKFFKISYAHFNSDATNVFIKTLCHLEVDWLPYACTTSRGIPLLLKEKVGRAHSSIPAFPCKCQIR